MPIPKDAITAKKANNQLEILPIFLFLNAFLIVYIGPPDISPLELSPRYFVASIHSLNFVVSPNNAEIHIHNKAPGPPDIIAVATPTILPVPIVEASAVVSDEKGETSPFLEDFVLDSLLKVIFIAYPRFFHVKNRVFIVRKKPVPIKKTSIGGPHIKLSTVVISSVKLFIAASGKLNSRVIIIIYRKNGLHTKR